MKGASVTAPASDTNDSEILPGKSYTLQRFEEITGIGPAGRKTAEEEGLKVATVGRNRYILGAAWFEYLALKSEQSKDWCDSATALLYTIGYLGSVRKSLVEREMDAKDIAKAMTKAEGLIRKMVQELLEPVAAEDLPELVVKSCKAAGIPI